MSYQIIKTVSVRDISICLITHQGRKTTYYATFFKGEAKQFEEDLNGMPYLVVNPKNGCKKNETAIKTTTLGNAEKRFKLLVEGCQNPNMKFV